MCLKIFKRKENDMQYTDNLNLNLPEAGDYIEDDSREAWNDNFESLDTQVIVKGDYALVTGSVTMDSGTASGTVSYPNGFTQTNCMVVSFGCRKSNVVDQNSYEYGYGNASTFYSGGSCYRRVSFNQANMSIYLANINNSTGSFVGSGTYTFKILLMKTPT